MTCMLLCETSMYFIVCSLHIKSSIEEISEYNGFQIVSVCNIQALQLSDPTGSLILYIILSQSVTF